MTSIKVCIGSNCHRKGAREIIEIFHSEITRRQAQDRFELTSQFCMKRCHQDGVCVTVDDRVTSVSPDNAESFIADLIGKPDA